MKTMPRLTKESEQRISAALSEVADLANQGEAPTDAIVKVATAHKIPHGQVRLMVRAYNNGRSLGHLRDHDTLVEKAAAFPLADAGEILERMFPSDVKSPAAQKTASACSDDYNMSPEFWLKRREQAQRVTMCKTASEKKPAESPYPVDPRRAGKQAMAQLQVMQREHTTAKDAAIGAAYKVASDIDALENYFRAPDARRVDEVRQTAQVVLGNRGGKLIDHVTRNCKQARTKAASLTHVVDWEEAPYSLIMTALDAATDFATKRASLEALEGTLVDKRAEVLRPFGQAPAHDVITGSVWDNQSLTKGASILGFGMAGLMGGTARGLTSSVQPKSREDLIQDKVQDLSAGGHEDKLRAIRSQVLAHELMAGDEVIRRYSTEDVMDAYNHLSEVAPRAMQHRVMAQSLLRKYLESAEAFDSFDIDQMMNLESRISERDMPEALASNFAVGAQRELGQPQPKPRGPQLPIPQAPSTIDQMFTERDENLEANRATDSARAQQKRNTPQPEAV